MSTPAQDVALHVLCEQLQKIHQQADAADATDSGLRFAAADDGNFVCSQCGAVIVGDFFA
jgi:hypothetical protein